MSVDLSEIVAKVPTGLFIGGEWRPASDGATIAVVDPATTNVLAEVSSATVEDARTAAEVAGEALAVWRATAPRVRSAVLRTAFELMTAQAEKFAWLISAENGKALADARAEVTYAAEFFRWFSEEAVRLQGSITTAPNGASRIIVHHEPIGVAALVTPWNYPAAMATRKIGPALAAGCSVVLKPASETPLTALAVAELLTEAGVPAGVVNVIPAHRSGATVSELLNHAAVRKISFTGSTEVGIKLLHGAADRVLSSAMELGGNAPFTVLDDADVDKAVAGAMVAKMRNGGEACTAANRFYVHDAVADEFCTKFATAMQDIKVGVGYHPGTELGPMVNEDTRSKIQQLVDDARDRGAKVLAGGQVPSRVGYFYPPTVLDHVDPAAGVLHNEIFGPVAPIVRFSDVDDALRQANDTDFGLVAYLFTEDLRRGLQLSERVESGMVGLNRGIVSDPSAPFGGVKLSGIGREGGHEGMLEYTESKYISTEW